MYLTDEKYSIKIKYFENTKPNLDGDLSISIIEMTIKMYIVCRSRNKPEYESDFQWFDSLKCILQMTKIFDKNTIIYKLDTVKR